MASVKIRAHYDGQRIVLDEPFDLKPETKLIITVLNETEVEQRDWSWISSAGLSNAYGDSEIEYSLDLIKEPNPDYEGR
ncbi:MAG: hypothetical protein ACE5IY_23885 [bacterium]